MYKCIYLYLYMFIIYLMISVYVRAVGEGRVVLTSRMTVRNGHSELIALGRALRLARNQSGNVWLSDIQGRRRKPVKTKWSLVLRTQKAVTV